MSELITEELVLLDRDLGSTSADVVRALAATVAAAGRATNADDLAADGIARETKTATGVPGGIGIPHCRSAAVMEATLVMARLAPPVDFGAKDGPADLVFFIAAPEGADQEHLKLLSKLARSLVKKDFTAALRSAASAAEIVALVDQAISPAPAPAAATTEGTTTEASPVAPAAPVADAPKPATRRRTLVAVTACPTGIAHTYMAADSLVAAAAEVGVDLQVETQGSAGATPLDPAVIAAADAVIFAVDVDVRNKDRFAGLPVIQVPVKRGVDEPAKLVADALAAADDPNARRVPAGKGDADADGRSGEGREPIGAALKRSLLTGVSYMIPFVAGGGLLIALGFAMGGYDITDVADKVSVQNNLFNLPNGGLNIYLGAVAYKIGSLSMGFLVPVLAGYIAYALADRPGLAPGFTAGAVAGFMGAGFLGGIVGGLLAGVIARWIGNWRVPKLLRGLMPVVIIPLIGSILASGAMFLFLGGPIAALSNALSNWLSGMSGTAAALVGLILGLMMAIDLGGPVNKVAYAFAVAGLGTGSINNQAPWEIMAAVMAAGMVPPLAMALATALDKKRFTAAEHENGKAAWLLGAAFISEGAIPFAAADPLRVIPASMLGAGVTGAMVMGFHVTSQAPHGGLFVWFAIGNLLMFLVSIVVGMVISALAVLALKRYARKSPAAAAAAETEKVAA